MHRSARDKRARNTDWRWSYEATHGSLASFVCEALLCTRRNLGSEALEMHAAYGGKREDGGLFIHTTLLERSGLETGDNGNWNENRSRRTVCFVLYCKSPGVFALLYWLFGLESRAYSESARCFTTRFSA